MKHIKLFEAYLKEAESNPAYDKVLDLYNEKGLDGMSQEEIEYLKSGGEGKTPKSLIEPDWLDCPFVLCVSEDIWKHYKEDLHLNPDGNKDYERDALKAKWRIFVFTGYEKVPAQPYGTGYDNPKWFEKDADPNGGWKWWDSIRSGSPLYNHDDFEYFGMYSSGLILYSFDEKYPEDLNNWIDFIREGGLSGAWEKFGEVLRGSVNDVNINNASTSKKEFSQEIQVFDINMHGKKLTWENMKSEIDRLAASSKLGDWLNNIDIVKDGYNHPNGDSSPDFYDRSTWD
jgi:hypothetical protein